MSHTYKATMGKNKNSSNRSVEDKYSNTIKRLDNNNISELKQNENVHKKTTTSLSANKNGVKYKKSPSSKRCSGEIFKYFEEELREKREREYNRELNEAIKRRKLWKQFLRVQEKDNKRALITSSGPEWWQEPSRKQITLATTLGEVIKADKEEVVTGRTRQWLLDLGVMTRLTPKQIRACMKSSLLNPIDFLLDVHDVIISTQKNKKKEKVKLEKPFSLDERLLLTAVCVLQLPTLLTMLHYILPPPEPLSKIKHVQELLYGDLSDESIRYANPYMEPLPYRDQNEFKTWAFDKIYTSLMPSLIHNIPQSYNHATVRKLSSSPMTREVFADIIAESTPLSVGSTTPSVVWLISHCVPNKNISSSMMPMIHSQKTSEFSKPSFSRQLSKRIKISNASRNLSVANNRSQTKTITDEISGSASLVDVQQSYRKLDLLDSFELNSNGLGIIKEVNSELLVQNRDTNGSQDNEVQSKDDTQFTENLAEGISSDEVTKHQQSQDLSVNELGLQTVRHEIEAMPKEKQLQHAINVLADMGDPLAQLPKVHKLPSVKRWLELRQGKKRILTQTGKEKLLNLSRALWKSYRTGNVTKIPKIGCTKQEERKLTWDKKTWLTSQLKKEMRNYFSRVRTDKVDNARSFFPTMLNNYDYGSNLNRNFRDIYFTYLPAREADLIVYRPWKPSETVGSRQK